MANAQGIPVWYEHLAVDADAAQAFYTHVAGWQAADSGMAGMDYRLFSAPDGAAVAGLMPLPPGMEGGPVWLTYFGVDDVDATAAAITAQGGAIHMPPTTMPGVGRMAMATDPQGHAFYIMRGESDEDSSAFVAAEQATPGHGVWNELTAADQDAAIGFYGAVLGLRHEGAMPMGPLGDYKFVHAGDICIGATMNVFKGGRRGWQPYFMVDDIDAAVTRIGEAGGRMVQGPDQIPGGDYALVAEDGAGVRFGLVGARKAEA
ncbi:VOC family protein [Sphingomonas baiyangensis]|uniref:VOC family protein n=1 Tax=Sphingomonas baiyangensis TaxID=2572576 RepID=A0A4U1LAB3_9SPHN|nr:VOC family protein [Sphingomonas baiyangensis]TKD53296.1 VOC family protein [Sphingomonas baiyangensis]